MVHFSAFSLWFLLTFILVLVQSFEEIIDEDYDSHNETNFIHEHHGNTSDDDMEHGAHAAPSHQGLKQRPMPLPWPGCLVLYKINEGFGRKDKEIILGVMEKFEDKTCIKFQIATSQKTYMNITKGNIHVPCRSFIGYNNTGPRNLVLQEDCLTRDGVLHELMHALGFHHEHNRYDRDDHIKINIENVDPKYKRNFEKLEYEIPLLRGIEYDLNSITHYDSYAFAWLRSTKTIIPKFGKQINVDGLSRKDILKVKQFYQCGNANNGCPSRMEADLHHNLNQPPALALALDRCPLTWTFDENYPNICYKWSKNESSENDTDDFPCNQLHQDATLPIFRDQSEYISYGRWWNKYQQPPCNTEQYLGIVYNPSTNNISWADGSDIEFSMPTFHDTEVSYRMDLVEHITNLLPLLVQLNEYPLNYRVRHYASGSHWFLADGDFKIHKPICQLRLSQTVTKPMLRYPTDLKCSNEPNWFYDSDSDICYYYYRGYDLSRRDAVTYCTNLTGASLPYFTFKEFWNFRKLIKTLHVDCSENLLLGYMYNDMRYYLSNLTDITRSDLSWWKDQLGGLNDPHMVGSIFYEGWKTNRMLIWELDRYANSRENYFKKTPLADLFDSSAEHVGSQFFCQCRKPYRCAGMRSNM